MLFVKQWTIFIQRAILLIFVCCIDNPRLKTNKLCFLYINNIGNIPF